MFSVSKLKSQQKSNGFTGTLSEPLRGLGSRSSSGTKRIIFPQGSIQLHCMILVCHRGSDQFLIHVPKLARLVYWKLLLLKLLARLRNSTLRGTLPNLGTLHTPQTLCSRSIAQDGAILHSHDRSASAVPVAHVTHTCPRIPLWSGYRLRLPECPIHD